MATSEEKQELVDHLSGPRYYHILIQGYGGEGSYMSISKEAHDFWKGVTKEHGDSDLVNYMLSAEDGDFDFEDITEVPEEAQFLKDEDGDSRPWYEAHCQYEHQYGGTYDACYLSIDEVDSTEYTSKVIREIIDREDVSDLVSRIGDETDWTVELCDSEECYAGNDVEYIAQMYSSEKGCFFDGVIETVGDFDPKKLVFHLSEYDNGEESITSIEYDGKEIDNNGGDTNGKGYYASVWKNE